ncbi:MAG: precorrin-6A reductase [Lachnospiraceae bacterium]|nr:precorrin-6A reductase [Lachnospiraceae bacterium]
MNGKKKAALFAGTTEGRLMAGRLAALGIPADVYVATEYGKEGLAVSETLTVFCGRLAVRQMAERFREQGYVLVIDATHPYAREASQNIRAAARETGIELWRVLRERTEDQTGDVETESVDEAVSFLKHTEGPILAVTGSRELAKYKALPDWKDRVYARVLPLTDVIAECTALGFTGKHLIAMQGPFSRELNAAMLAGIGAKWLVTKESGKPGGFEEKRAAARDAKAKLLVIRRPEEEGLFLSEAMERLAERFECRTAAGQRTMPGPPAASSKGLLAEPTSAPARESIPETGCTFEGGTGPEPVSASAPFCRHVWLIGMGPGDLSLLTGAARKALQDCQLIVGAARVAEQAAGFGKPLFKEYRPKQIFSYLCAHPEYTRIAAVFSGDTGFYSGARKLYETLCGRTEFQIKILPGISSMHYFFSRLGRSWERVKPLSLHGQKADFVSALKEQGEVFLLGGGRDVLCLVCRELLSAGLGDVRITVGEELSLPGERIYTGTPESLKEQEVNPLTVLFLERCVQREAAGVSERPENLPLTHGLADTAFLRGDVPMTKMEVRTISVAKLMLTSKAVVYDVGAGTGSVAVECARLSKNVTVYAVEQNKPALELLEKNRDKFKLTNLNIVSGRAPGALENLPPASHVFIGGSGGALGEILKAVFTKNPHARIVMNLIMPETLTALFGTLAALKVQELEIVQVTVARSKKVGPGHLMMGQNPVWIVSFTGGCEP